MFVVMDVVSKSNEPTIVFLLGHTIGGRCDHIIFGILVFVCVVELAMVGVCNTSGGDFVSLGLVGALVGRKITLVLFDA